MQTGYIDLVTRLQVARVTGHCTPDLIDTVLNLLAACLPAADRRIAQREILRSVADLLGADLPPWQRAGRLAAAVGRWSGRPTNEVGRLLHQAKSTGLKIPKSQRAIYDLLVSTEESR